MNNISWSRMKMLFRHDLKSYGRQHIFLASAVFFPLLLVSVLAEVNTLGNFTGISFLMIQIALFAIAMGPAYMASHIFVNMRSKQDATAFAMLPATNVEKYVVRFVDFVLLPLLIVLLSLIAFVLVFLLLHGGELMELASKIIDNWEEVREQLVVNVDMPTLWKVAGIYILMKLASVSFFALGGTVFGKYAIVKTWLLMFPMTFFGLSVLGSLEMVNIEWILVVGSILVLAGSVVLSYILFSRKQII